MNDPGKAERRPGGGGDLDGNEPSTSTVPEAVPLRYGLAAEFYLDPERRRAQKVRADAKRQAAFKAGVRRQSIARGRGRR